jgi:lysophospholipase L1-like esterase
MTALFLVALFGQPPADPFAHWESEVATIEKRFKETPPKKGGVVFAGSSTIRLWDLYKSFPEWNPANCGFGGSQIADSTHFASRLVIPLEPRAVVFYAGDNDVNAKRTPEQVRDDFRAFVKEVHGRLPKCTIHFLSIKPSVARRAQFETQTKANALVKADVEKGDKLDYIDLVALLLGPDGKPKSELFAPDGLHLNEKGYELCTAAVRRVVK